MTTKKKNNVIQLGSIVQQMLPLFSTVSVTEDAEGNKTLVASTKATTPVVVTPQATPPVFDLREAMLNWFADNDTVAIKSFIVDLERKKGSGTLQKLSVAAHGHMYHLMHRGAKK
jgi:hypothetical protein